VPAPSPEVAAPAPGLRPHYLAAEAAVVEGTTLFKGFVGFTQAGAMFEIGFGYGETQVSNDGYPVNLRLYALDFNRLVSVYGALHLGMGVGVLVLQGGYQIPRPTQGPKDFLVYLPVVNLKLGWKLSFVMFSVGVSYPVPLEE
jgi:hypothetical protein